MNPNELLKLVEVSGNKYTSGIYMIYCLPNNKAYIGHSKNISSRWGKHKWDLKNQNHINGHLQNCFNKYGAHNLLFFVLENTNNLKLREAYWLSLLKPSQRLNLTEIDIKSGNIKQISKISARKGIKLTEKEKINMSKAAKNRSEESKERIKKARWTPEHRIEFSKKRRKVTNEKVQEIKEKIKLGYRKCDLEKEYSISESIFYKIKKGSYLS